MHIITDTNGRIIRSSVSLQEGLNVFGKVHGVVQDSFILSPVPASGIGNDADPVTLDAAAVFVFVKEGRVVWASSDICALRDLFFAKKNAQEWVIGDSFFELASHISVLTAGTETISFFLRKGFFLPGQTFFREIFRVPVGMRIRFAKKGPLQERVWGNIKEGERTYETFKRAFASVLEVRDLSDDSALLLSGGCDSGLLAALAALQRKARPLTLTSSYKQTLKTNEWDAHWSKLIAEHLGLEHVLLEADFDKSSLDDCMPLVEKMPLTAHLSLGFLSLYEEAARRKKKAVWAGQNADSVYTLGPSSKGKGGTLKRWYLTREYWQSLPDIRDKNPFGFFMRAVGSLGPLVLYMRRGVWFRQPETFGELLHAFEQAEEALALPRSQAPRGNPLDAMTSLEAKQMFFERKVQTFLIGGDPRVHQAAAENFSCDSVLPYSAANMMHFFRGLPLTLHDVFRPKRFIYQYLQELLGKKAYLSLYGSRKVVPATSKRYLSWKEWQASVLRDTRFGQGLRESLELARTHGMRREEMQGFDEQNLQHMIGLAWFSEVMRRIEGAGARIEIS